MAPSREAFGQATVETVGLWALVAVMLLTVGALVAREAVVDVPQPDAIERVARELDPPAWVAPPSDPRPGIGGRVGEELGIVGLDALRFRQSLDHEFGSGFVDRLELRGRQALQNPVGALDEILQGGPSAGTQPWSPEGTDAIVEIVRYADRLTRMEPGDASRVVARDLGGLTADEVIRRLLRAGGRRAVARRGGRNREEPSVGGRAPRPSPRELRDLIDRLW